VIRPVERYIHSAKIEADIIIDIMKKECEHNNRSRCVKLEEYFYFSDKKYDYIVLVFEKLGKSLYEFIKQNNYRGYPIVFIQAFAKQMFEGIGFLHEKMKLTHTDLKPENLLLIDNKYDIIKKRECFPKNVLKKESKNKKSSPSTGSYTNESNDKYYLPISNEIRIIDFGGATYEDESHTEIINTRQYRAPEVILGSCQWNEKSDIWSMACILIELYSGELFFPTHNNFEHLCLIEKAIGHFPYWMTDKSKKEFRKIFECNEDKNTNKIKVRIDMSNIPHRKDTQHAVDKLETLDELIDEDHNLFKKFLEYIFVIDPDKRPSCKEALNHEFFRFDFTKLV